MTANLGGPLTVPDDDEGKIGVLLLISGLTYGGAERQLVELANNLDKTRFVPIVCSLSSYNPLAQLLDVEFEVISKRTKYDLGVVSKVRALIRRKNISIVQSFLYDANIVARLCRGFGASPCIISTERNSDYEVPSHKRFFERITRLGMSLMMANSFAGKDHCIEYNGIANERIVVIHNGVDSSRFCPSSKAGVDQRSSLGLDSKQKLIGMVGNFKEQKNHRIFVLMAKKILEFDSSVRFIIVGNVLEGDTETSTRYRDGVYSLVEEMGLAQEIQFLTGRDDMTSIYNACDVTILPSTREGTPNVVLESMACGTPVVASNVADNAYVLQDGQDGRIVDLGDEATTVAGFSNAVLSLLNNSTLAEEMGCHARSRIETEFSLSRLVEKTAAVYEGLLTKSTD